MYFICSVGSYQLLLGRKFQQNCRTHSRDSKSKGIVPIYIRSISYYSSNENTTKYDFDENSFDEYKLYYIASDILP